MNVEIHIYNNVFKLLLCDVYLTVISNGDETLNNNVYFTYLERFKKLLYFTIRLRYI